MVPPCIRADNFQITNVMLTLLEQRDFFTGAPSQNAYKHLKGFVETCWGSKQINVSEDVLRLRFFPFSLQGKALDWLERLPNHSIHTWDELAKKFISKFFSLGHMATLQDEILAFKQEPNEPLHEICECYRTMIKEYPNNDMTENMIQQTFYRGINTTNQCVVNQLVGGNFMTTPYAEACKILDEMEETSSALQSRANVPQGDPNVVHLHKELHDHGQAISELTTTMIQLVKAQLQQVQNPKQVNTMEGVNIMVIKRRTKGPQVQYRVKNYVQENSDFDQDDYYNEQEEEILLINVPLVKALEQMLGYTKFMKGLVTKKRSMNFEAIKVTHQVSAIVYSMAPKLEDPGAFMIPCTIGSAEFPKALCDLGESINLMPYSVSRP
ncbi:uncharacterized protein [Nicotiana tomentosiformis]|uniref:uncharacterized protein n=1 Tax=Nicotiana tomentosiformis TaxID=4098 RepID=UPI00388CD035